MTIIKQMTIECTKCGFSDTIDDLDDKWDEYLDLEDVQCPGCIQKFNESIFYNKEE